MKRVDTKSELYKLTVRLEKRYGTWLKQRAVARDSTIALVLQELIDQAGGPDVKADV